MAASISSAVETWDRYEKLRIIGAGAFGQVILVRRKSRQTDEASSALAKGDICVLKRIYLKDEPKSVQSAAVEVKVLQGMQPHPNIIRYYDHFLDSEGFINIAMEFCRIGDLERFLATRKQSGQKLTVAEVLFLSFQLLAAVAHLHQNGVMHRDLKPANVFLCDSDVNAETAAVESGRTPEQKNQSDASFVDEKFLRSGGITKGATLKVADFGISHVMQNTMSFANTVIGTPFYISPEIVESKPYTTSADMWAVGCIIYEMASTGVRCFAGDNMLSVVTKIAAGAIPAFESEEMNVMVMPLVKSLVVVEAEKRLSAAATLKSFFTPSPQDTEYMDYFEEPPE